MDPPPWASLDDAQLLDWKIRKLELSLEDSALAPFMQQLHDELAARGLAFLPPCHVGDEWFVPVGIPAIFVPFFLVHERLRELERRMMLEVEGETPEWFMKLMRHEAGHAYSYAYRLYRRRKWQETFGLASAEDTGFYRPRPYSRSYVVHLDDWYAQAHPDEDFAETFAVWLTPGHDWRERYRGWNALHKLEYVDALMRSLAGRPPPHQPPYKAADYDCLNLKLKTYYARKRKLHEDSYPDFYDRDLRALFPAPPEAPGADGASTWLRRNRRAVMNAVCDWTNEKKYRVDKLLQRLVERCGKLRLVVAPGDAQAATRVTAYVTTLVMNHLFTGRFKRGK
ncbi:MAG: hypothetical protein MUC42_16790 [Bryobacter sp.]|nr:hypothetical protein [Bryobacter sp.]